MFKKENNKEGEVYSEIIYMNDHIYNISTALGMDIKSTYEDRVQYMINNIKDESLFYLSNIIMYVKASYNNTNLLEFIPLCSNMKYISAQAIDIEKGEIHFLMCGDISHYKNLFRNSDNVNNKILLSVKEQLYQVESVYFNDFIKDGLMKYDSFLNYNPTEKINMTFRQNGFTILDIDNYDKIQYILRQKEIFKDIQFRSILDLLTITFKSQSEVLNIPYKEIYKEFNEDLLDTIKDSVLDYINHPDNSTRETIETILQPSYKKMIEYADKNVEQKEFYEDVDEVVNYID